MGDQTHRHDTHPWSDMTPQQVLNLLVHDLYTPISLLSGQLNRLTCDEDPLTEDEMDAILDQMQRAVRQLSRTVVYLKQYARESDQVSEAPHTTLPPDQEP